MYVAIEMTLLKSDSLYGKSFLKPLANPIIIIPLIMLKSSKETK